MQEEILQTLYYATSQDIALIKLSEEKLKSWETIPGFYLTLQNIFLDKSLPINIRWMSIIYLKNGINKYWRKSAKNSLCFEEKERIRERLFQGSYEENQHLVIQNSLVAAKIARLDFPDNWPHLFQELFTIIKNLVVDTFESYTFLHRYLYTLYQIVKNLCASRLIKAKRDFQQVVPELFEFIYKAFKNYTDQWIQIFHSEVLKSEISPLLQTSHLCFKILRRLIVYGFEHPYKNENARSFFQSSYTYLKLYFNLCEHIKGNMFAFLYSYIILFGKMFLEFSSTQLTSIFLMPDSTEIIMIYLDVLEKNADIFNGQETDLTKFMSRIIIQGLLLIKHCVKFLHNSDLLLDFKLENYKQEIQETYKTLERNIFNPEMIQRISEILITKYIILRPNDLFLWEENPEQWFLEEEKQSWEYNLRLCTECLFADIFLVYNKILFNPFMSLFQTIAVSFDENTFFLKEAVYNAFGIGISSLHDFMDFDDIFTNFLLKDIETHSSRISKIIYRRILILISQCTSLKCSKDLQSNMYSVFQKFLGINIELNDLVVRLTAATCLEQYINKWNFEKEQFSPYLKNILENLLHLINQCELSDSKLRVLQVINTIIERMEQEILPYVQDIINILPLLWEQSEEGHSLKTVIIVTLAKLSLREESQKYHPLIIPLIEYSINLSMNTHIYLMNNSLELWHILLQKTPNSSPQILSLIPLAINCLDYGSDILKKVFCIFESYVLLSASLYTISIKTFVSFGRIAIRFPIHLYADALLSSGFIFKIFEFIMFNKISNSIIIQYFTLISRICLQDPHVMIIFLNAFSSQAKQNVSNGREIIDEFLETWISIFSNIGNPKGRVSVFNKMIPTYCSSALIYWNKQDDENDIDITNSPETIRREELMKQDPIHKKHLKTHIREILSYIETNHEIEQFKTDYQIDDILSISS
ncbi:hypothetical protein PCANB_000651 [Pneumocystis canis]|nr:hypothetical protein PCANB_000651 [Pneumocystis canis]